MEIFSIVFLLAWVAGVASWFFAIAELIAAVKFYSWVYTSEIKIIVEKMNLPDSFGKEDEILEFMNAKAKIISHDKIFFRKKYRPFKFQINKPLPINGVISKINGVWYLQGRIPIFTTLFILAWLIAWTSGGIMSIVKWPGSWRPFFGSRLGFRFNYSDNFIIYRKE